MIGLLIKGSNMCQKIYSQFVICSSFGVKLLDFWTFGNFKHSNDFGKPDNRLRNEFSHG